MDPNIAQRILMIRPIRFGYNPETAHDNVFQKLPNIDETLVQKQALEEFEALVAKLEFAGIEVTVVEDTLNPFTPDSVFPNNWISTHTTNSGTICLFPMAAPKRRFERKQTVLDTLEGGFEIKSRLNLTFYEKTNEFLEGTGSMILDRQNSVIYAAKSRRTSTTVLDKFASELGFDRVILFEACDSMGIPIYHTNVMMCLGDKFAVICLDTIWDLKQRAYVEASILNSGREVIQISMAQMNDFAGNMLQLQNNMSQKCLVMSSRAYNSLEETQQRNLGQFSQLIHSDLTTIENAGGGSARCMIAEIYLSPKIDK